MAAPQREDGPRSLFLLNLDTWVTRESLVWLREAQTPVFVVSDEARGKFDDEIIDPASGRSRLNLVSEEAAVEMLLESCEEGGKAQARRRGLKCMTNGEAGYGWLHHHFGSTEEGARVPPALRMLRVCSDKREFRAVTQAAFPQLKTLSFAAASGDEHMGAIVAEMRRPNTEWILKPSVGFCAVGVVHWGSYADSVSKGDSEEKFSVAGLRRAFDAVFKVILQEAADEGAEQEFMVFAGHVHSDGSNGRDLFPNTSEEAQMIRVARRKTLTQALAVGGTISGASLEALPRWSRLSDASEQGPPDLEEDLACSDGSKPAVAPRPCHQNQLLIETFLQGPQYTADGYFDAAGEPRILTVSWAPKDPKNPGDIREVVLGTDLRILREQRPLATEMMRRIQEAATARCSSEADADAGGDKPEGGQRELAGGGSPSPRGPWRSRRPFFRNVPFMAATARCSSAAGADAGGDEPEGGQRELAGGESPSSRGPWRSRRPFFRNFPFMVEYRVDPSTGAALPIEVNSLRHEGKSPAYASLIYTVPLYDFYFKDMAFEEKFLKDALLRDPLAVAAMVFARKPDMDFHADRMDFDKWVAAIQGKAQATLETTTGGRSTRCRTSRFPNGDNYFFGWARGYFKGWEGLLEVLAPDWEKQFVQNGFRRSSGSQGSFRTSTSSRRITLTELPVQCQCFPGLLGAIEKLLSGPGSVSRSIYDTAR